MRSTLVGNIPTWVIHIAHFVLRQDEICAKLATAQYPMAMNELNDIPSLAAKAYHCLCMVPGQHDEEYFGW